MANLMDAAVEVVRQLREAGHESYFAGGFVRDRLLGRPIREVDIATAAPPDRVEELFRHTVAVGKAFGVIRVRHGGHEFEVATFRTDGRYIDGRHPESVTFGGPQEDARRRDFTINGMFYDPTGDAILDFVEGRRDLERRLVRAIGDPTSRFNEDHLRLMRAVRFAAQLGFEIDSPTLEAIRSLAPSIRTVSGERIRDELAKLLVDPGRSRGMELLRTTGLLKQVLPEVEAMVGVPQPPEYHPEGDVWTHTLLCLDALQQPTFELALATLLHDVGKPPTMRRAERIRFDGHDKLGGRMAGAIAARLKLSNEQRDRVVWLVDRHLAFLQWELMRQSTLKRLLAHDYSDDLLRLVRADTLGSKADDVYLDRLETLKASMTKEEMKPKPLITGNDLIALGFTPGPAFKSVLTAVYDAQLEGRVREREEALALARTLMSSSGSN